MKYKKRNCIVFIILCFRPFINTFVHINGLKLPIAKRLRKTFHFPLAFSSLSCSSFYFLDEKFSKRKLRKGFTHEVKRAAVDARNIFNEIQLEFLKIERIFEHFVHCWIAKFNNILQQVWFIKPIYSTTALNSAIKIEKIISTKFNLSFWRNTEILSIFTIIELLNSATLFSKTVTFGKSVKYSVDQLNSAQSSAIF